MKTDQDKTEKIVGVWFDETSDAEWSKWVVADEELFEDGETAYTATHKAYGSKDDAVKAGEKRAAERGVRLVVAERD